MGDATLFERIGCSGVNAFQLVSFVNGFQWMRFRGAFYLRCGDPL